MSDVHTTKKMTDKDANQVLTSAYNNVDATISVNGFVNAQLNNSVQRTPISATIDNWSYYDGPTGTLLYVLQVVYDDSAHDNVNSVTRIV